MKKVKKSVKIAANKMAQAIYDEHAQEYDKARLDALVYGIGIIAIDPEGGLRCIPLEALSGGEIGKRTKADA